MREYFKVIKRRNLMKVLTMGSPASNYIFDQEINEVYNGNYETQRIRSFYTLGHLLSSYEKVSEYAETVKDNKNLYDFLIWNFQRGGFWGKLEKFQPDLLVLDLLPEIYFGNLVFEDGTMITHNFRVMNDIPDNVTTFDIETPFYIRKLVKQIDVFQKRVQEVSPHTKLIFNGARFPTHMSKNGVIQKKFSENKYRLSIEAINKYNKKWEKLDKKLRRKGFDVLKFDQDNSAAELKFPTGENDYYLYNQNYYTDVQSQIEVIAEKYNLGPTTFFLDLNSKVDLNTVTQKVVFLNVPNTENNLKVFRKNKKARIMALKLAANDYILHGNMGSYYRFVKRTELKTKYPKFKDVHYRIIPPKENKKYWSNRMIVRMFGFVGHYKTSVYRRNFQRDFPTLKDSIVKDTYILEIGDINLIDGSYYTNTKNYPDFEDQVQELIQSVAEKYEIVQDNIVLYGPSRGGAGAVLHAALGNYKFLAADPVINDMPWYTDSDFHFIEGVREVDLTDKILAALANYSRPRSDAVILGSSNVGVTFSSHLRLPLDKITLLDLNINLYQHPGFNGKTVPIQLSYLNCLLIKDTIQVIKSEDDLPLGVVFEVQHLAKKAINFAKITHFRIRLADIEKCDDSEYELAMKNIEEKYKRVKVDQKYEYFESV